MRIAVHPWFVEPRQTVAAQSFDLVDSFESAPRWDNVGNHFIAQALSEILDFEEATVLWEGSPDHVFDYINQNCSHYVIRGATFLGPERVQQFFPIGFLEKIHIPIVIIGYGFDSPSPSGLSESLTPDDRRSLAYIHDSSASSMVRGPITQEILHQIGIHNVKPLGCPTIYWSRRPEVKIRPATWGNVVWTWREYLYSPGQEDQLRIRQLEGLDSLRRQSDRVTVLLQDKSEGQLIRQALLAGSEDGRYFRSETIEGRRIIRPVQVDLAELESEIDSRYATAPAETRSLMHNAYFSFDVHGYCDLTRQADFVLGCRLHGNLSGLSQGTPAYFYSYDARLRDVLEVIEAPHGNLLDDPVLPELDDLDFSRFEKRYVRLFEEFAGFLDENGLAHRLGGTTNVN